MQGAHWLRPSTRSEGDQQKRNSGSTICTSKSSINLEVDQVEAAMHKQQVVGLRWCKEWSEAKHVLMLWFN